MSSAVHELIQIPESQTSRVKRICLITGELAGPDYNGGIGTANRGLALALREAGYDVDVLYTRVNNGRPFCFRGSFSEQVKAFQLLGIRLMCIWHTGQWNDWLAKSHLAMQHLLQHRYDLVFFDDTHGTAYYPLLARRTGNADLARTVMCVVAHSATEWIMELNEARLSNLADAKLLEIERRGIELADALVCVSSYIKEKYRSYGWTLPAEVLVQPNIIPGLGRPPTSDRVSVKEIVFFGRLEARKGLWTFCSAIDRLQHRLLGVPITFLGKSDLEEGQLVSDQLLRRSSRWPFAPKFLMNFDREQALAYLSGRQRLAVMPSREDNSPSVILECLSEGIPFIASNRGGGGELISSEDHAACLFEPTVAGLTSKLEEVLSDGIAPAQFARDPELIKRDYLRHVAGFLDLADNRQTPEPTLNDFSRLSLLTLVPAGMAKDNIEAHLGRWKSAYGDNVDIHLLFENKQEYSRIDNQSDCAKHVNILNVALYGPDDFKRILHTIASSRPALVGISHITQPISPEWLHRAATCFASSPSIAALSGVCGVEDPPLPDALPTFVSKPFPGASVREHIIGNASALLGLAAHTNSGFLALRPSLLPALSDTGPYDHRYGRMKRMTDWVHELLSAVHDLDHGFELIPDIPIKGTLTERPFEVFRTSSLLRDAVEANPEFVTGSDKALLTRYAIDKVTIPDRITSTAECMLYLAERLPTAADRQRSTAPADLAALAFAAGQTELATELLASDLMPGRWSGTGRGLSDVVLALAAEIHVFDMVVSGQYRGINLAHEWSIRTHAEARELELHPNAVNEGRATLELQADLSATGHFTSSVALPGGGEPVRIRIDINAIKAPGRFSFESEVTCEQVVELDLPLPASVRRECRVMLSVEMTDPASSPENAYTRWHDPRFSVAISELGPAR